jgi:hypothetical protein
MTTQCCESRGPFTPRTTVGMCQLENMRMPTICGIAASSSIPRTSFTTDPLQDIQKPELGRIRRDHFIPRTTMGPLQYLQMSIPSSFLTNGSMPLTAMMVGPLL